MLLWRTWKEQRGWREDGGPWREELKNNDNNNAGRRRSRDVHERHQVLLM